jgi:LacI family transcriptional regulator
LDGPSAPTALVTGSVLLTLGVMEELRDRGADVPGDLSLVGFGDEPGFSWWGPGLTTMGLPVPEMATGCALWLMRRLTTKSPDDIAHSSPEAASSTLPGSLILRGSTASPDGRA